MAIKRRSSITPTIVDEAPKGLNIVAKPKTPLPPPAVSDRGIDPHRIGLIAQSVGDTPDEKFSAADRVKFLRTPFDKNNPQEQRYRNRVKNRGTAITAMCIVCTGGRKAVTECAATKCPLWAFRMGSDPFRGTKR